MDPRLLRTFLTVAETGSFTSAARALNYVQSNVTAQIRNLEEEFGQRLFHRGKGGARLTWFGEIMRQRAEAIMQMIRAAESDLHEAAGAGAPLVLGALETVAATRLPALLGHLRQSCPDAKVSLRTGPTATLLDLVWKRDLDGALVAGQVDEDRFRQVPAFREKLVCVTAGKETAGLPLLAFPSGCSYRAMAERWMDTTARGPAQIIDLGSLDGILGCAEVGLGMAVIPLSAVRTYHRHENLHVLELPEPFRHVQINLVWRHDHAPVAAHRALLDFLAAGTQQASCAPSVGSIAGE